ncbi:NAD(P)-binding domain-containing protein [Stappia taiwanensis]|uniref:Pyrroline-5-carboxylate reductase n=1 Tax=Stappia taiwanensis TaxID=992267 RepID=A0A838XLG4_9HYPH|nr:pyrroline-5-carboxylate reductase dimerization domain-containing protein [Stappia taiwanensis]MBA4612159.1 NAD(P)-binding domain-containing protein [Stappia taiwanensis]GGE93156.1 pyrroline-5-carboxylate reductase [Stappia taiwanensis]
MTGDTTQIGIVGGSGALGSAIAMALLESGAVPPQALWISNRSGSRKGFEAHPEVTITSDTDALTRACGTVILSVPPASVADLRIAAEDRLVISVMAGVTLARLRDLTGATRVVRAMSSPAARLRTAYSPWVASTEVNQDDRSRVKDIFSACGLTDELTNEAHLDQFTAMTGPVPGFVAFYAECMIDHAVKAGIAPEVADRAIRQLFLSAGTILSQEAPTPCEHVEAMIDYAGTTAAGLEKMRASPIAEAISEGLEAAARKARSMS